LFEWSDKTNRDKGLIPVVVGSNLVKVEFYDHRPMYDSKPDAESLILERSDKTNQDNQIIQVQTLFRFNLFFGPYWSIIKALGAKHNFLKDQT
jgi:hypothetical protein